jgi:WD40 repeat protein
LVLIAVTLAGVHRPGEARRPATAEESSQTPQSLVRLEPEDSLYSVALSPGGKTLAGAVGKRIRLCDVATGKTARSLVGHDRDVLSVAFSPDGKTLASGGWDKGIRLWDPKTGRAIRIMSAHEALCSEDVGHDT